MHRKNPNRKFSLRFGKEETSTEDKKPCLQGFVPSWSFLTRLRRPYLFSRKRKDGGEKSAWGCVWCILPLNPGKALVFRHRSTRDSPHRRLGTRRLIRGIRFVTSCRRISAIHRRCRPSLLVCTFLRGVFLVFEHQKPSPMRGRWHGGSRDG